MKLTLDGQVNHEEPLASALAASIERVLLSYSVPTTHGAPADWLACVMIHSLESELAAIAEMWADMRKCVKSGPKRDHSDSIGVKRRANKIKTSNNDD